jgi:hypothetical protein
MALHIDSDASYLSMPQASSRAGGYFYLSSQAKDAAKAPTSTPPINGAIHVLSHKLKNVMASAAEAEVGALFVNGQEAVSIRNMLLDMGHPQAATPIKTDNSTAAGIANNTMKQRRSRAMDMRFYWIRDRVQQQQVIVYWRPGTENLADYFTKHHAASHHREIRDTYIVASMHGSKYAHDIVPSMLQGCVKRHPARTTEPVITNDSYSLKQQRGNTVYESAQHTQHSHTSHTQIKHSLIY